MQTLAGALLRASVAFCLVPLVPAVAGGQTRGGDSAEVTRARHELQALFAQMAAAVGRGDRAGLEQLFAPEYVFIHGSGYENDRATHITELLAADSVDRAGFAARAQREPSRPGELHVYGDIVVQRVAGVTPNGRPFRTVTVYGKRNGRWQYIQAQSTLLQPARPAVAVSAPVLDSYAGEYGVGPDGRPALSIRHEQAGLIVRGVPVPFPRELLPVAATRFFDKLGIEYTFFRDATGQITHVETRYEGGPATRYDRHW